MVRYKPINFVVLRTSGIPLESLKKFNLPDDLLDEISNQKLFNEDIGLKIKKSFESISKGFPNILKDYRMRDLIRVSTSNHDILIKKTLKAKSILSQYHRKILMYLQRGSSKCCTAGSYGPVATGEFEHSANNVDIFNENEERFIMLEDWALSALLSSQKIKVSEDEYHKIMENYTLLNNLKNSKIDSFIRAINSYKNNYAPAKRDILYRNIFDIFKNVVGEINRNNSGNRKKDYEGRSIFYELKERDFTFQIGGQLKKDFGTLDKIMGIYLVLLTKKYLEGMKDKKIKSEKQIMKYVFDNFYKFSENIVDTIISEKIIDYSQINYSFDVMPPIFSPDISVASKNLNLLKKGNYKIVLGEIHVSATVISNPMYEFKRGKLINNFVSSLKGITNQLIDFQGYKIEGDKDFTHHLPMSIQDDIVEKSNESAQKDKIIYAYRSNKFLSDRNTLFKLLFFPMAIGRKLIFNHHKDEKWGMWSRDYFPQILDRISKKLYPLLSKKLIFRESRDITPPEISLPRKITSQYIFSMMKKISEWKKENNLEDEIFVRYTENRKPIYVNLKNPYLIYEMIKLGMGLKTISISNFYPKENCQWLKNKEGSYCNEFRYMVAPMVESQKLQAKKNIKNLIYLPGYQSRFDELLELKKSLFNSGINVESLNLNYNQKFESVAKEVAKYIEENYAGEVNLMGLSFGGVLSFRVAQILGNKVSNVFSLNPFSDRKKILKRNGYKKNFENIRVKDFFPKNVPVLLISAEKDDRISFKNSKKLAGMGKNIELAGIKGADHTFSKENAQEEVAKIIRSRI